MGVSQSTDLPFHFQKVSECKAFFSLSYFLFLIYSFILTVGPKSKVESVIQSYNDGEYDFGIDYSVVMHITGYDENDARELIQAHNKNDTGL